MRLRGAIPSPRHRLAGATPHRIVGETPAQWLWNPAQLLMWLNDIYGDCCTAEEAFAKACSNPEILISNATVGAWASANGFLNGAYLIDVLDQMLNDGFLQDGKRYNNGKANSVDWTNAAVLRNAIAQGPVKLGVAADQLDYAVPNPPTNGWLATGFHTDRIVDHCTSLCGYGSIAWLLAQFEANVPSGVDGTQPGYGLFTWKSIGVIDVPSMVAITGEAWLRNPTTIIAAQKKAA